MRVLLLHNRYRHLGGEERAVADQMDLLERRGHEVILLERDSDDAGRARAARSLIRGGIDPGAVRAAVLGTGAQIVHAHNLHPLLGWRALAAAREAGARTVFQLHNFRLFCAIGVAYRGERPCHDCKGRNTLPGLAHRCRGSVPEALAYAAGLHRQQPHFYRYTDRFAVLSDAHGALLHAHGLPEGRADTIPNFVPDDAFVTESRAHEGSFALTAGRLVAEKGFDTAIRAAAGAGVPLVIAGTGPDEPRLRTLAQETGADVRFAGWVPPDELSALRADAGIVLVPSRCEEACPYAVLEALAAGVPVLGSDRGGTPELVGFSLPADRPEAWSDRLAAIWGDEPRRRALGKAALATARERFTEDAYHARLIALYETVLADEPDPGPDAAPLPAPDGEPEE